MAQKVTVLTRRQAGDSGPGGPARNPGDCTMIGGGLSADRDAAVAAPRASGAVPLARGMATGSPVPAAAPYRAAQRGGP